jgi:hypothetical protein
MVSKVNIIEPLENINEHENEHKKENSNLDKNYECDICNAEFTTKTSMYRHKRKYCTLQKNAKENTIKLEDVVKKQEDEIKFLKNLVEKAGKMVDTTNKIADQNSKTAAKSLNALSYIIKNYADAPTIESVKKLDYTKIKSGNNDISTTLAAYYDDDLLYKYLGEYIVNYYKTDDLSKRSFWGTDVSRCTFITRTMSENNELQWIYDMKGKCMGKSIIDPMLEHIRKELLIYIDDAPELLAKSSVSDGYKITSVQRSAYKILDDIKSGTLKEQIIREISPHFYLNRL